MATGVPVIYRAGIAAFIARRIIIASIVFGMMM